VSALGSPFSIAGESESHSGASPAGGAVFDATGAIARSSGLAATAKMLVSATLEISGRRLASSSPFALTSGFSSSRSLEPKETQSQTTSTATFTAVGIGLGVLLVVAVALIYYFVFMRKQQDQSASEELEDAPQLTTKDLSLEEGDETLENVNPLASSGDEAAVATQMFAAAGADEADV
jgi:hypothetical protein